MPYIEGLVAAVPKANKQEYLRHAIRTAAFFRQLGATRSVECWGDDVPKGALTDFYKATQAKDDEVPVFSWVEYPDKATRDAAVKKMNELPGDKAEGAPFDVKRMFWGGFEQIYEAGPRAVPGEGEAAAPAKRRTRRPPKPV